MPLSDIGSRIPFGEAIFLVEGLMREPSSHLAMTLRGWEWAAGFDDVALITLAEWYTNAHRDTKAAPDPFRFPRPWPDVDRVDVTAEERAVLERKLLERSALRDR